MGEGIWYENL